jgi:hypothetical protein
LELFQRLHHKQAWRQGKLESSQSCLAPVHHHIPKVLEKAYSQNPESSMKCYDMEYCHFCEDVGGSRHLDIMDDVLLGDALSCTVLGAQ